VSLDCRIRLAPGDRSRDSAVSRALLEEVGVERSFDAGEVVLPPGRRAERIYFVSSGQLKMCRVTPAGRNLILALPGPGDVVGVASALGGAESPTSVEALVPTVCLEIRKTDLYALFARRPDAAERILPLLTRHLRECGNCIVETACSRVETRFAALFLRLAEDVGTGRADGTHVPLRLARQELADLGGTTLETAIRVMSRWGKEDLVQTLGDGFLVRDRNRLEELSRE
jgi:CRP/FNR family transcriptional regulator